MRSSKRLALAAAGLTTLAVGVAWLWPADASPPAPPTVSEMRVPERVAPTLPLLPREAADEPPPSEPKDPKKVDVAEVERALAQLRATSASITDEQLRQEQIDMEKALERMRKTVVKPPKVEPFTDEGGMKWLKLTHESGEVRYELPPAPDQAGE